MEDAHAVVLDLQAQHLDKAHHPTDPDKRLSFFGVYDGHGGDRVALFAGDNVHRIITQQAAFAEGDIEQAMKDGFLATDRAILEGWPRPSSIYVPSISLLCFHFVPSSLRSFIPSFLRSTLIEHLFQIQNTRKNSQVAQRLLRSFQRIKS